MTLLFIIFIAIKERSGVSDSSGRQLVKPFAAWHIQSKSGGSL
jgi:hypothetical protein